MRVSAESRTSKARLPSASSPNTPNQSGTIWKRESRWQLWRGVFPRGTESPEDISLAISEAVSSGADEIDCVLEPRDTGDFPGQEELAKLIAMREASSGLVSR